MTRQQVDLDTASRILGISADAVRKRVKRGVIKGEKDDSGRWRVFLPDGCPEASESCPDTPDNDRMILDVLKRENEFLRKELERRDQEIERRDQIIMSLTQRVPPVENPGDGMDAEPARLTWWKRIFGDGANLSNKTNYNDEITKSNPLSQGDLTKGDVEKDIGEVQTGVGHEERILRDPIVEKDVGEYTWPDGAKYVGEYMDGKPHGQGTITKPDGEKYVGEWKDGRYDGQGTWSWNGTTYVGGWKDNKMHGQGTLTLPDGKQLTGEWRNNVFVK